jgi:hypothetical protein
MMILSIDVGRDNLALCCLEAGEDPLGLRDVVKQWVVTGAQPTCRGVTDAMAGVGASAWRGDVEVVIERQPGTNTQMVRLQCYLEMYFAARGCAVTVFDPKRKLAFAATTPFWPTTTPDDDAGEVPAAKPATYHARKKLAVQSATRFLDRVPQAPEVRATFESSRKKDDLADCLLQAMAYAHR